MTYSGWLRTLLGFLIAPISPVLVMGIFGVLRTGAIAFGARELSETAWMVGLAAALGYPVAFIVGAPLYVFLRWRGWNGLPVYVATGALLGLVVYGSYVLLPEYSSNGLRGMATKFSNTALVQIPLVVICGAVATMVFWLIARPDRSGGERIDTTGGGSRG